MDDVITVGINPGDYPYSVFPPHGRYTARIDGSILRMVATGPFNVEMAEIYSKKTGPLFAAMSQKGPFGVLFELHESMMMSRDAVQKFADFLASAKQLGARTVGTAFVVTAEVEGATMMVSIIRQKIYEPAGVPLEIFETVAEADQWLATRLAAA